MQMRRAPLRVVAFRDSSAIPVKVSFYALLGVSRAATKDTIKDAYEALVKTKLQVSQTMIPLTMH